MREQFRDVSPEDAELQPIIEGLFGEYAARYGDYFSKDAEVELTAWYLAPQGLFIVLERDEKIIATGAYKPFDERTAEIKRIWTDKSLRQQGLAARVVQELERRAVQAGYSQIYLTTGFRQPEAVRLYLSQDTSRSSISPVIRKSTASRRLTVGCVSPKRWYVKRSVKPHEERR